MQPAINVPAEEPRKYSSIRLLRPVIVHGHRADGAPLELASPGDTVLHSRTQ
jgi:hypothetical protein